MGKLKVLSGREVIKIFELNGFIVKRKVGSHVRMSLVKDGISFHVTIPNHDSLKKGTLYSIIKDFETCFGKEETNKYFYTE